MDIRGRKSLKTPQFCVRELWSQSKLGFLKPNFVLDSARVQDKYGGVPFSTQFRRNNIVFAVIFREMFLQTNDFTSV